MTSLVLSMDDALLRRAREAALAAFEAVADGSSSASSAPWPWESPDERR